jgi:hypothetical protein
MSSYSPGGDCQAFAALVRRRRRYKTRPLTTAPPTISQPFVDSGHHDEEEEEELAWVETTTDVGTATALVSIFV